ncbi:MAG: hypothetical protein RIB59_03015 [Rhodospirillales bacterium]
MIIQIILGFILLLGGAELMVRGAVNIAKAMGISTIVIGMTVVAFGTSSPELVVSVDAALQNAGGIALGNVIGSNIANILLILGVGIVVVPPAIKRGELTFDAGGMLLVSIVFAYFCWRGTVGLGAGLLLLGVFVAFYVLSYRREIKLRPPTATKILREEVEEYQKLPGRPWVSWLAFAGGLGGRVVRR